MLMQSDIERLPECRGLEHLFVDDKSLEVMLRIETTMQRLAVMDNDEQRMLWFEVQGRRLEWYRIITGYYRNYHFLTIYGSTYERYCFCSNKCWNSDRNTDIAENDTYDVANALLKVEDYVTTLVDAVLDNPDAYNAYVEKHLSYYMRTGLIRRSVLNSLIPDNRIWRAEKARAVALYKAETEPMRFDRMTLRNYMHYWRIAYESFAGEHENVTDEEIFEHSSKGYNVQNYDLDSETEFKRWMEDVGHYHGFDVVYARVHLIPTCEDGQWYLKLFTGSYWDLNECLMAAIALFDAGIPVMLENREEILAILLETDYIEICPHAYRYMQEDNVGSQISLPYPSKSVSREIIKAVIANTEWEKQEAARPNLKCNNR